ncbi:YgjV family protein [Alphaproteobacteria bacterium]|nr:YgjV family protein [Alphaproteobacteria bacterium]
MDFFSVAQLAGWFGAFIYIASLQVLDSRKTIFFWIPADLLYAVHYFMLGSVTAGIIAVVAAVRDGAGFYAPEKALKYALVFCFLAVWILGLMTLQYWYEVFPIFGGTFVIVGTVFRNSFMIHRVLYIAHNVSWLCFGVFIMSYPLITVCLLLIISNCISIWRYRNKVESA